ncbi:hypothetical protein ACHAWF_004062 [Thalassiosira exigua]
MGNVTTAVLDPPSQKQMDGNLPQPLRAFLRNTFLMTLQKDQLDDSKLCPIGIPNAIRCILGWYSNTRTCKEEFCTHLMRHNFSGRLPGGMHFVGSTIQEEFDRYIAQLEAQGKCSSRCLVRIDIRNMFNAISRRKLLSIIPKKFPQLSAFIHLLYDQDFHMHIPLVLKVVLVRLIVLLRRRARQCLSHHNTADDGHGGITSILAYVDDNNALVPIEGVLFYLHTFENWPHPLVQSSTKKKNQILTSTLHCSVLD